MTERVGNVVVIYVEDPQGCEFCGEVRETRPYGPGGKEICFPCSEATPERQDIKKETFGRMLEGEL